MLVKCFLLWLATSINPESLCLGELFNVHLIIGGDPSTFESECCSLGGGSLSEPEVGGGRDRHHTHKLLHPTPHICWCCPITTPTPPISCSYHIKSFPQAVPCLSRRFSVHRPVCDDRCVAATKTIACSNCRLLDKYWRFKLVLPFSCFSLHVFVCISPFCCEPRSGSLHNWSL